MEIPLGKPASEDDLYLARCAELDAHRPVMQGDVFRVTIRSVEADHEMAMVISHPCTMREGPALRRTLSMLPVVRYRHVPLEEWPSSHFRVFPLPNLFDGEACAARFDEIGMVLSERLTPESRVACLSENGILLLQQRQVFALTRAVIGLDTLEKASHSLLAEAELLEDWNRALVSRRLDGGQLIADALRMEAQAFDDFLASPAAGDSLRKKLGTRSRVPEVRRAVRAEITRRLAEGGTALTGGEAVNGVAEVE